MWVAVMYLHFVALFFTGWLRIFILQDNMTPALSYGFKTKM